MGARVGPDSRYFRQDGTSIAPVQVTDSAGWNATFGMHRADLVTMLAERLPANVIHTGPQRACPWYEGPTSSIQCRCYGLLSMVGWGWHRIGRSWCS